MVTRCGSSGSKISLRPVDVLWRCMTRMVHDLRCPPPAPPPRPLPEPLQRRPAARADAAGAGVLLADAQDESARRIDAADAAGRRMAEGQSHGAGADLDR